MSGSGAAAATTAAAAAADRGSSTDEGYGSSPRHRSATPQRREVLGADHTKDSRKALNFSPSQAREASRGHAIMCKQFTLLAADSLLPSLSDYCSCRQGL